MIEVPVYLEKTVEVEVEKRVAKYVEVPNEILIEEVQIQEVIIPIEKVVEKKIRRSRKVPRDVEVEKIVEKPVEVYIDKIINVEKIIEKPVYVEKIVQKKVEKVIEKKVEVPIEKFVEVRIEKVIEKPFEVVTFVDKPIYIDHIVDDDIEIIDNTRNESMQNEIAKLSATYEQILREKSQYFAELSFLRNKLDNSQIRTQIIESRTGYEENVSLRNELNQLHEEYNRLQDEQTSLYTSTFRQDLKKSGYGNTRLVQSRDTSRFNDSITLRSSHYQP